MQCPPSHEHTVNATYNSYLQLELSYYPQREQVFWIARSLGNGDEHRPPGPPQQPVPQAARPKPGSPAGSTPGGEDVEPEPPRGSGGGLVPSFRSTRRGRGDEQIRERVAQQGPLLRRALRRRGRLPGDRGRGPTGRRPAEERPEAPPAAQPESGAGGGDCRGGAGASRRAGGRRRALRREQLKLLKRRHSRPRNSKSPLFFFFFFFFTYSSSSSSHTFKRRGLEGGVRGSESGRLGSRGDSYHGAIMTR
ncbi:unnamed protein product [Musa acuminata subsp. malaccensis]|uniref:(wild Malaysian banana) hypothetical protein n=1 Tax=Musa acuminata subsp. malaccensis TaxID=214687 RepID=A0A8D7B596_MUSAM|nr:unnamed protein product [Musa acuminata subsp. malaccensis]